MATKNFFVHDGLKVRGDTLLNGSTYTAAPSAKLHIKTAANGAGANLNNVNGLIIENGGSSNTNYALKLATGAGNIFSITNAGRVGIGTTTPNEELTVVGDISASGSIYGNIEDLAFTDLTVSGDLTVGGTTYTSGLSTQTLTATTEIESPEFIGNLRGAVSFKAKAGEALTKGDAVYISGISGNTTVVGKADADDSSKMPAFGIANESVSLNGSVTIINFGAVTNLNTSSYPEGTELYVSTTAGALTSAAPTGESSLLQKIAKVTRQDNSVGSITVMGAGRTNAVPNLNEGRLFVGNSANQAVADDTLFVDIANSEVGINNVSPDRALHVKPTSNVPAIKVGYDGTQGNGSLIEFDNGYTQKFYVGMSDTYASRDFVIAEVSLGSSTDATNPKYVFNGNGDGAFYITDAADNDVRVLLNTNGDSYLSGGNVGIGTVSPSTLLTMQQAVDTSVGGLRIQNSDNSSAFRIWKQPSGGASVLVDNGVDTLFIKNGSVGIGTASPVAKLDISVDTTSDVVARISNEDNTTATADAYLHVVTGGLSGGNTFTRYNILGSCNWSTGIDNSDSDKYKISFSSNLGTNDYVTVKQDGLVGIGITNPGANLHVYGSGQQSMFIGSSDGARALLELDGAGNGDGAGGDYAYLAHNADGTFDIKNLQNNSIRLATGSSGTTRMAITSAGNVGIGINDPAEKLHVAGDIRVGIGGGSYNRIEFTRSNDSVVGGIGWHTDDVFYVAGHPSVGSTAGNIVRVYGFGSDIRLGDSVNGDVLNIDKTTGFVGIGTVTPARELEVTGIGNVYTRITAASASDSAVELYNGTDYWQITNEGSYQNALKFRNPSTRMVILSSGNIGIGTAAPDYTLDVDGTLRIQNTNSSSNYMTFSAPGVWDVVGSRPVIKVGGTEKMRASANGVNIGGSTDATHTLDVDGTASFSSDITIGGNMTVSGDLSVVGAFTYLDTEVTVTSAMDITNTGTGPALVVNQTGEQPVIDIQDDGTSIFYVEDGGNVGMGTTNPDQKLHIFISDTGVTPDANSNLVIEDNDSNNFINVLTNNTAQGGLFFGDSDDSNIAGILYDHTNELLQLRTNNNNNRVTITSGGYVGIGTTEPANKLELNTTDVDVMRIRGGASARIVFTENTTNRGRIGYGDDGNIFSGVAANSFAVRGENELHLGGDGTLMMTLNSSGVGIGITNHSNIFSIKDELTYDTTTRLLEITNSGNAGGINITGNNGRLYMQGYRALEGSTGGGTLTVGETFGTTSIPNHVNMALTDAKLVGVGTSNPQAKLHIAHSSNSNVIIQESVNSASPPQLSFYSSRGTVSTPLTSQVGDSIGSVTYYGMGQSGTFVPGASIDSTVGQVGTNIYSSLDFKTRSSTDFGTRMIITSGGNVGIGITTPTDLLDIHSSTSDSRLLRLSHPTSPGQAAGFLGYNTGNSIANLTFTLGVQYSSTYYNVINIRRDTRNIGLGSLNPENFLELYLNDTTDTGISLRNDTQTWAQIHLKQHVSETHAYTLSGHSSIFTTDPTGSDNWPFNTTDGEYGALVLQGRNSTNGGIVLRTGNGGTYRNTLVARENGKVGIDVDDPNEKLTVSGNISASGIIYADAFQSNTGGSSIDLNDDISVDGNIVASGYIESTATSTTSAMVLSYRDQFKKTFTSKITWNHTAAGVQYFNLVFPYTYNQSGYMYDFKFVTDRNSNYVNFGFIRDNSYIYIENDAGSFHRQEGLVQSGGTFTNSITLSGDPSIIRNDVPDATSNGGSFSPNYSYFIVRYPIYFPNATAGTAEAFVHVDVYSQNDDAEVAFLKT